jgi:polyribonucleotide nucleotidyltransferase
VVDLGDEIEVRVDDIDPQGKVSLSLAGDEDTNGVRNNAVPAETGDDAAQVSFEDSWEAEAQATFGDLGPAQAGASPGRTNDDTDRGPRRNPRRRRQ